MTTQPAIEDRDAILTHAAIYWNTLIGLWQLLALGCSEDEIEKSVAYWRSKGTDHIRVYELHPVKQMNKD